MRESDVRRKGIREELQERLRVEPSDRQQATGEEFRKMVDAHILEIGQRACPPLKGEVQLRASLFSSFRRLDVL